MVHLGVGSFHRSHQAVFFDDLAQRGHTSWGLTGISLRHRALADALVPQNGLYTVVERGARCDRARVVGVMSRYHYAPDDRRQALAALADPRTKLVTLTVTGSAYHIDPATGEFNADAEELRADLARTGVPRSALGLVVEALRLRRDARDRPFTVLSCDNLPRNGVLARRAILAFARLRDPRLAAWIEEHVAFPSSMVDRITPVTTDADRDRLAREFGIRDRWPVVTEPFSDWVIEDAFCGERPPLDEVGVRFTSDVRPYSLAKTRLLNASHLMLGVLGRAAGARTMPELMGDQLFRTFVRTVMAAEIAPGLPPSDIELDVYLRSLFARLANPNMGDQLDRLCRDATQKLPRHVLPSLLAAREEHRAHPLLTIAVAGVCRLVLRGVDDRGRRLDFDDPQAVLLRATAGMGGGGLRALLGERALFGHLGEDEEFVAEVEDAFDGLEHDGTRATIARALTPDQPLVA